MRTLRTRASRANNGIQRISNIVRIYDYMYGLLNGWMDDDEKSEIRKTGFLKETKNHDV